MHTFSSYLIRASIPFIVFFFVASSLAAQTLNDPTISSGDSFGSAVATDGNLVVVGARRDDTIDSNVGQAYAFDLSTQQLLTTYDDPTETTQDNFGAAIAVDNNRILIAAPLDSSQGDLIGQAQLFDAATEQILHTFDDPTPTNFDFFGTSVDLQGDLVLIGAPGDNSDGPSIGQAHLFDAVSGNLIHTFADPTASTFDSFGQSVALEGNLVAIGAPGDDTNGFGVGQVHLFDADTGNFVRTIDDPAPTGSDAFGSAIAMSGGLLVVGAPNDDSLGTEVGSAYLFDANTGALIHTLSSPNTSENGLFGSSVDIEDTNIVIGAPGMSVGGVVTGVAYLFDSATGEVVLAFNDELATDGDEFGYSVALAGSQVIIGSPSNDSVEPDVGAAFICPIVAGPDACVTILGDVNLDQAVTLLDVSPFIALLNSSEFQLEADMNLDGVVDLLDVSLFVDLLIGP